MTWEQFLSHLNEEHSKTTCNKIYIVTKDGDYFVKSGNQIYLNPQLYKDLDSIHKGGFEIYCFDNLSDFLKYYNEQTHEIESLDSDILDKAREEEVNNLENTIMRFHYFHSTAEGRNPKGDKCPYCNSVGTLDDGFMRRSMFGGLTLQYRCSKCRGIIDTCDDQDF